MKPWREAARAIVLDPTDRVLLVGFRGGVWAGPGGGLDPGESHEAALRRELAEELGLEGVELGPCIWTRAHAFDMDAYCGQRERIYLVRTPAFEPTPRVELAAEAIVELRWWTCDELAAATVEFSPRRLPELVRALIADGPPAAPLDVGI